MANAGTVTLGLRLEDNDFLTKVKGLGIRAGEILSQEINRSLKGTGLDLSSFQKSMKKATEEAAKTSTAGMARAVNQFKMPKIKVEYDKSRLEQMLDIYNDRWTALDNQRRVQEKKVNGLRQQAPFSAFPEEAAETLAKEEKKLQDIKMAAFQADAQAYQLQETLWNLGDAENILPDFSEANSQIEGQMNQLKSTLEGIGGEPIRFDEATESLAQVDRKLQDIKQASSKAEENANRLKEILESTGKASINMGGEATEIMAEERKFQDLKQAISEAENQANQFRIALEKVGSVKEGMPDLTQATNQVESQVDQLKNTLESIGENPANLDQAKESLAGANTELKEIGQAISEAESKANQFRKTLEKAGTSSIDTSKIGEALTAEEKKLQDLKQAISEAKEQTSQLRSTLEDVGNASSHIKPVHSPESGPSPGGEVGGGIEPEIPISEKPVNRLTEGFGRAKAGAEKFLKVGLAMMGIQTVMRAIRKAVEGVGASFQVMAANDANFANSLNGISQAAGTMRGAFAAAVAPIVSALIPALQTVIGWATKAFNALALFFGALTGKKSVQIAVGSTEKFTKSMGGAGAGASKAAKGMGKANKEAEKYKRTLAGFDELEIIDTKPEESEAGSGGGSGGGGGGGAQGGAPIFKEVSTGLGDFQNKIGAILDSISQSKAFEILKSSALRAWDEISTAGAAASERISASWEKNGPRIGNALKSIATGAGNAASRVLGYIIIPAIAGGVAAATTIGASFVDNLLNGIATGLEAVDTAFAPFFDSINEFFDEHGPEIADKIYETWRLIGEGVASILDDIGLVFEAVFGGIRDWFIEHGPEIKEVWTETWETIWSIVGPIWVFMLEVGTKIFTELSDFFAEIAPKIKEVVTRAMDAMWALVKPIWEDMLAGARLIFGALKSFWEKWGDTIKAFFKTTWEVIKDVFKTTLDVLIEVFGFFADLFSGNWEGAWNHIKKAGLLIWDSLKRNFEKVMNSMSGVFEHFGIDIKGIWAKIKETFQGIIDFVTGVFTGNWRKAWEGVKTVFKNIVSGLVAIFKAPINGIINLLNHFINGINKIKIPDWVPGVGGKGINIPRIPKLAKGGIIDQPTLSLVGEEGKEAVVPLENHTGWMDQMASKIAGALAAENQSSGGSGDISITVPVYLGEDSLISVIEKTIKREEILRNAPVF